MISPPKRNKKTFSGWISCLPFSPIWNRSHRWKPNKTMMEYIQTTIKDHRQRWYSNHHQRLYSNHHQRPPSQRQTTKLEVERKHFPSKCALHLFEIWSWWQSDDGVKYNCFHFSSVGYLYIFHVCFFQIRRVPLPPLFEIGSRLEMIIASTMN